MEAGTTEAEDPKHLQVSVYINVHVPVDGDPPNTEEALTRIGPQVERAIRDALAASRGEDLVLTFPLRTDVFRVAAGIGIVLSTTSNEFAPCGARDCADMCAGNAAGFSRARSQEGHKS